MIRQFSNDPYLHNLALETDFCRTATLANATH
ncbi:hypothetical protein T11_13377 [Trichinella zimbabwensis]|uniref:Uncharacterized protein n=2 Tax=Trichinella TaxID=6333 RepID=A0A0V1LX96_9BILA|nr:hypothetical protein T11_13377 [Trichinella zimbabwensis]KRZ64125.1 hypothetical protein T10_10946 [Trichinella papuae]